MLSERLQPTRCLAALSYGALLAVTACGGKSQSQSPVAQAGVSGQGQAHAGGAPNGGGSGEVGSHTGGAPSDGGSGQGAGPGGGAESNGGSAGSGATARPCLDMSGQVPYEIRTCRVASDCNAITVTTCCGKDRVLGMTRAFACAVAPPDCSLVKCAKSEGYVLDDGQETLDSDEAFSLRCQIGEPGAGLCQTSKHDPGAGLDCGDFSCSAGEVCVHDPFNTLGPTCEQIPPGCGAPVACSCAEAALCEGSSCLSVMGRHVTCGVPP